MREILNLHIGQAGIQMGHSMWELMCTEHSVLEDGSLYDMGALNNDKIDVCFSSTQSKRLVPRCVFADLEPTVIDEIRNGSWRKLYNLERLIDGPEDAASNFARGYFTIGKLILARLNTQIRKMFESADCVQGIMIFRSLGGGTGSGLTSAIFDNLADYQKTSKVDVPIYPSPTLCTSTVEPYNALMAEHFCIEEVDIGLLFDNEALYDICTKYLLLNRPLYNNINRLIAQLCSSITAPVRFDNVLNCDLTVLQTNIVPYPRIHFPLSNFYPILPACNINYGSQTVNEITHGLFEYENQMVKIDPTYGRFMSCALFYRGSISPDQVHHAILDIKRDNKIDFVEWCPTAFKVGICSTPPTMVPGSQLGSLSSNVAMLTNSSTIGQAWQRLTHKFYILYAKRSFLHWFVGEGMEESEFTEGLYNISTLVKDYEEVTLDVLKPKESGANSVAASSVGTRLKSS